MHLSISNQTIPYIVFYHKKRFQEALETILSAMFPNSFSQLFRLIITITRQIFRPSPSTFRFECEYYYFEIKIFEYEYSQKLYSSTSIVLEYSITAYRLGKKNFPATIPFHTVIYELLFLFQDKHLSLFTPTTHYTDFYLNKRFNKP